MNGMHARKGLRIVAVFEAAKGLLVLLVGCGLIALMHRGLHEALEQIVRHMHLNPAHRYPGIFLDLANNITDSQLWIMAVSALLYAIVRFVEAYGLWTERQWAEWFGLLTGSMYIPIELLGVIRGASWHAVMLLIVNIGISGYLARIVWQSRKKSER